MKYFVWPQQSTGIVFSNLYSMFNNPYINLLDLDALWSEQLLISTWLNLLFLHCGYYQRTILAANLDHFQHRWNGIPYALQVRGMHPPNFLFLSLDKKQVFYFFGLLDEEFSCEKGLWKNNQPKQHLIRVKKRIR